MTGHSPASHPQHLPSSSTAFQLGKGVHRSSAAPRPTFPNKTLSVCVLCCSSLQQFSATLPQHGESKAMDTGAILPFHCHPCTGVSWMSLFPGKQQLSSLHLGSTPQALLHSVYLQTAPVHTSPSDRAASCGNFPPHKGPRPPVFIQRLTWTEGRALNLPGCKHASRGSLLLLRDHVPRHQRCFQTFFSSCPFQQYPKAPLYVRAESHVSAVTIPAQEFRRQESWVRARAKPSQPSFLHEALSLRVHSKDT